jgi:hypothetical protein
MKRGFIAQTLAKFLAQLATGRLAPEPGTERRGFARAGIPAADALWQVTHGQTGGFLEVIQQFPQRGQGLDAGGEGLADDRGHDGGESKTSRPG